MMQVSRNYVSRFLAYILLLIVKYKKSLLRKLKYKNSLLIVKKPSKEAIVDRARL